MASEIQCRPADEFIFRPCGCGRFLSAIFLSIWLCGWFAGESFAVFILGHGIWSLLTGSPAIGSGEPARMAPALAVGAFLLVWLTLWTFGGIMSIRELLSLLWAEDRLVLDRNDLVRIHRLGPFTSIRCLARNDIRRVYVQSANTALMVQLNANLIELTSLGTPAERIEAGQRLCTAIGLPDEGASTELAALPEGWQEASGLRGERLLIPDLQIRRKQAIVVAIITGVVWASLILLAREAASKPTLWVVTLMLTAPAVWLARQTLWMIRGRKEWRIGNGKLIHQLRFADEVTELGEARALELTESRDSDGDLFYHLNAVELSSPACARSGKTPKQLQITYSPRDATEPRCLGRWLSQQAGIPLHDRVPTEADKQAEIARQMKQLASSGRLGRFIVRLIDRSHSCGRTK